MMLPAPRAVHFGTAFILVLLVLVSRPIGIFLPAWCLGKTPRICTYVSINLSQLSEFMLVISTLGVASGHIDEETLEIVILAFAILAVSSSYMMKFKHRIFSKIAKRVNKLLGRPPVREHGSELEDDEDSDDRDILITGFHKIAFLLIGEMQSKSPELLSKFHVIDNNTNVMPKLREMGIKCTYGDIASASALRHARKGMSEPRVVMSTIPDTLLMGVSNEKMVENAKKVWPEAYVIAIADDPASAKKLYDAGASYVVRMAKLSAERIVALLSGDTKAAKPGGRDHEKDSGKELMRMIRKFRDEDKASKSEFTSKRFDF